MKLKLLPSTISSHSFALRRDSNYNASSSSSSVHRHKHSFIVASKSKKHRHNDAKGSNSQPSPPRITSNAKQNLQILKTWKEYEKRKSTAPRPSTSYRKKKAEKEKNHDRDPISSLDNSNQFVIIDDGVPVMLVDGYNVCGYWMKLKKYFMSGRLELARQMLIDELKTFSMIREIKVVVVFDAMMSGFPNHKERSAGIDIVFSSKTSADIWIEKEVSALKKDGCPKVWVVTSDRCHREAAYGEGAFVWSCKTLVTEIEESHRELGEMLQEQRSTSFQGSLLKHSLSTEVLDALRNLRQKLSENESK
ncbi:uncharacterized protein LOC127138257 isoform X1 [Lathyrus oleraceus]|nr:uncharacterized protein LOC127138257 isoform X1 [Pisum sativum]KAI5414381.1 hypothetical protein KIW84_040039 [Pisum sativum]